MSQTKNPKLKTLLKNQGKEEISSQRSEKSLRTNQIPQKEVKKDTNLNKPKNIILVSENKSKRKKEELPIPIQADFTNIKVAKPKTEEMPGQSISKIQFSAAPLPNQLNKQVERSLSEPPESKREDESKESINSKEIPNTPPLSIRNLDLVYTQGKYKNIIPDLDFSKLKKKKKLKNKKQEVQPGEEIIEDPDKIFQAPKQNKGIFNLNKN